MYIDEGKVYEKLEEGNYNKKTIEIRDCFKKAITLTIDCVSITVVLGILGILCFVFLNGFYCMYEGHFFFNKLK